MAASDPTQQFLRDPALPHVESRRACHSRACYRPHSHPTYSIGAVDEGASVFTGAPDGPVRLAPGTLVFLPAMLAGLLLGGRIKTGGHLQAKGATS